MISIFTTETNSIERADLWEEALDCYSELSDEVISVEGSGAFKNGNKLTAADWHNVTLLAWKWPKEFSWEFIGQQFQRGYEACTEDWAIHMDSDFIFHEGNYEDIKKAIEQNPEAPALTFWKYQIFTPDRYNLKSRIVLAVNKKKYGDRIRFDSGGDLCQPSLDGKYIDPLSVPEAKVPIWNYECILKTKAQLMEDKGRMARAWQRHFGEYKLGGPDDESAYNEWWKMIKGRYTKHLGKLDIEDHPKIMQETLKNLKPEQFGYSAWGLKDA